MDDILNYDKDGLILKDLSYKTSSIKQPKTYKLNFDKIKTTEDLIEILKSLNITISEWHWLSNIPKEYLIEVE